MLFIISLLSVVNAASITDTANAAGLTTLVAAIEKAGVTDIVNSLGPATVFAPTNAAFAAVPWESLSTEELANVLSYHIVNLIKVEAAAVPNDVGVPSMQGEDLLVTNNPVAVNGAQVVIADVAVDNGAVVHVIETVLMPPKKVSEVATDAGLTSLVAAIVQAGLVPVVDGLESVTIFAPTNAAFAAAGIDLDTIGIDVLTKVLTYHILGSPIYSSQIVPSTVETVEGSSVTITTDNGVMVNDAKVVAANVLAQTKNVIHVIDKILMPKSVTCGGMCGDNTVCMDGVCQADCPGAADTCCTPGDCTDTTISECVCDFDPYCCSAMWDAQCVMEAQAGCAITC